MAQCDEELACLRARTGNVAAPAGFLPNEGHINCIIPMEDRALVVPHFIQQRGSGQVEMVAGRAPGEPVYVSDIYLTPNYSHIPTNPMGPWFLQLLTGATTGFNTLTEAAHELPDWEPYAKIMHYQKWEEERQQIDAEVSKLTRCCAILQEAIDNCRSRLEARGVPFLLHNLEGHTNLPHGGQYVRQGCRTHFTIARAPL